MPSTYSVNTGLELIATGEKSGSWGSITNGNLQILDAAVNGAVTVNLTGEGASYNLDTSNWLVSGTDVSAGQNKLITLTGGDDPSPASRITINITGDAAGTPRSNLQKLYFISTSSLNYPVEISIGTGAQKVNIDDGDFKIVYADGSDEVKAITDDLTVSSIKVTGGTIDGAAIGATNASTAVFSNATISAGNIDNTVIGNTTPAAAEFSALTVDNAGSTFTVAPGTSGSLNNVVIGGSTPLAGSFTTVSGTNITGTGNLQIDGNSTLGNANTDTVTVNAKIASSLLPSGTTMDLGGASDEWRNLYITGTANIDSLVADTADINGGNIDNTTIGATGATDGTFTTLNVTTLNATTVNGTYFYETQVSPTLNAATFTLDADAGSVFYCTHNTVTNITFAFTNVPASGKMFTATILHNYTGTGARSGQTFWPSGTKWPNGTQPSDPGPNETDIITMFTFDGGTTWYAGLSGINMS